ncbi:MAG: ABC transporter permease, partial [Thermodesulfobacteriota bacterium]
MQQVEPTGAPLTTADGVPLKISLQKALMRKKVNALLLVAPLFLFILLTFLLPIFDMLLRSVDNKIGEEILPNAIPVLAKWDETSGELPDEEFFKAFVVDGQKAAEAKTINKLGKRLNYEKAGMSSLFRKT